MVVPADFALQQPSSLPHDHITRGHSPQGEQAPVGQEGCSRRGQVDELVGALRHVTMADAAVVVYAEGGLASF